MATVPEAIVALSKLIEEADSFASLYRSAVFEEKLKLWTKRGQTLLNEWGISDVAKRFGDARGHYNVRDEASHRYTILTERQAILQALHEDMTKHPDFYMKKTERIPIPEPILAALGSLVTSSKVFLGHGRSPLWSKVERWLEKDKGVSVEAWETEPRAGQHVIQVLQRLLASSTFAVLVVTGEDATAGGTVRARQNVVHEVGLFQGRLGFEKVALLEQEAIESFSNIDGLQTIRFPDQRIEAAFPELERMLKREGVLK